MSQKNAAVINGTPANTNKPKKAERTYALPRSLSEPVPVDDPRMVEFLRMHTYRRPNGSKTEANFIAAYIDTLPGVTEDGFGNRIVRIGSAPVVWSCHTDTVHRDGGIQKITFGAGVLTLSPNETNSNCLGADCTVGVWLMKQMILRGVEGLYIFHRAEEVGGLGSAWIAKNTPGLFEGIDIAIAFDRKGRTSIITHQYSRCCSNAFGNSLIAELGEEFRLDDTGTFTDTANYTELVAECTNLSVGYYDQHTAYESTDVYFAFELLEKLCMLDVSKLTIARDPTAVDEYDHWWKDDWMRSSYGGRGASYGYQGKEVLDLGNGKTSNTHKFAPIGSLEDMCFERPDVAFALLEQFGIDEDDFKAAAKMIDGSR